MDFSFSDTEITFRDEVRQFLLEELPPNWDAVPGPTFIEIELEKDEIWDVHQRMARKLGQKGWLSLSWPEEYGGLGRSNVERTILSEEMSYHRAPGISHVAEFVAPILIGHGTQQQCEKHLKPIGKGESYWAEGFSEPEAGSDLASLRTQAIEHNDGFYIQGQKVWTSLAPRAGWCALLARTDPNKSRHKGISFFFVDMTSPGVTVRPLVDASGGRELTEVFFDNVRVPRENIVGEKNQGWAITTTGLSYVRSGARWIGSLRRFLDDILAAARDIIGSNRIASKNDLIRHRLAQMTIQVEISRLLSYRVAQIQDQGLDPVSEASMMKMYSTETIRSLANIGMQLFAFYGQLGRDSKWAPLNGMVEHLYICAITPTIAGGTSEILRNVIAVNGLGMPR